MLRGMLICSLQSSSCGLWRLQVKAASSAKALLLPWLRRRCALAQRVLLATWCSLADSAATVWLGCLC